jgi:hypothetical protein
VTAWSPILSYLQKTRITAKQRGRHKVAKPTRVARAGNSAGAKISNGMLQIAWSAGSYHVITRCQREYREQDHANPGQCSE